ncbi:MAG: hypothetical protein EHM21_13750 [Chloroflexi bacterium]|nr:MAG: hypothetical protein EHM21_13750 [Chloroflexota bacterium]
MTAPDAPLASLNPGKGAGSGRPCAICQLPLKVRSAVEERLLRGDQAKPVWRWAVKTFPAEMAGVTYDPVARHKRLHLGSVKRAARKLSDSDKMVRSQLKLARDVLADKIDPQSYFSAAAIAQDVKKTSDRLDDAADDAHRTKQHSALASLSGALVRTHELRAKMGGSIRPETEINISIGLEQLHGRLDALIGAPTDNRQTTARGLLGLTPPSDPLPSTRRPIQDLDQLSNPGGQALTIDAEAISAHPAAESRSSSLPGGKATPSSAQESIPDDDRSLTGNSWGSSEPPGTRWR